MTKNVKKIHWIKHLKTCARIGENSTKNVIDSFDIDSSNEENHTMNESQSMNSMASTSNHEINFDQHEQHYQQSQHLHNQYVNSQYQDRNMRRKRKMTQQIQHSYSNINTNSHPLRFTTNHHASLLQTPNQIHETQRKIRSQQNFPNYQRNSIISNSNNSINNKVHVDEFYVE